MPEACFPQAASGKGGYTEAEVPPDAGRSTSFFRASVATILVLPHLETGWIPALLSQENLILQLDILFPSQVWPWMSKWQVLPSPQAEGANHW